MTAGGATDRAQNRGRIVTLILLATLNYSIAAEIGGIVALMRILTLRNTLEQQGVSESGAKIVDPDVLPRLQNWRGTMRRRQRGQRPSGSYPLPL